MNDQATTKAGKSSEQPSGNANTSGKKSVVKINVKLDQKPS